MFSDWRNCPKIDYSTNAIVTNYYSGGHAKYFRAENIQEFTDRLNAGETLTLGTDYYSMTPISAQFLTERFIGEYGKDWLLGKVIVFKIRKTANGIIAEPILGKF